jgi:hypothetical protein
MTHPQRCSIQNIPNSIKTFWVSSRSIEFKSHFTCGSKWSFTMLWSFNGFCANRYTTLLLYEYCHVKFHSFNHLRGPLCSTVYMNKVTASVNRCPTLVPPGHEKLQYSLNVDENNVCRNCILTLETFQTNRRWTYKAMCRRDHTTAHEFTHLTKIKTKN